jgi:hypothetical protein
METPRWVANSIAPPGEMCRKLARALGKQLERAAALGIGLLARYWLGQSLIF